MNSEDPYQLQNPAERLKRFIEAYKAEAENRAYVRNVLSHIYDIPAKETEQLTRVLIDIWQIPEQILTQLDLIEGMPTQTFRKKVSEIAEALASLALGNSARSFDSLIGDDLIDSLGMISSVLEKLVGQHTLDADKRSSLKDQVNNLLIEVGKAELDTDFKLFAINRLEQIAYAIDHYGLLGTETLIKQVEEMFGGLIRRAPSIASSPKSKALAKKLYRIGVGILVVMELTNNSLQLAQNLDWLISEPSSTQQQLVKSEKPSSPTKSQ